MDEFLNAYLGAPYVWCLDFEEGGPEGSLAPFWRTATVPPPAEVRAEGICCVGVVNIWRLKLGKETYAGTGHITTLYENFMRPMTEAPTEGAMLVRKPRNAFDQGHVALWKNKKLWHSFVEDPTPREGPCEPGFTVQEDWLTSHQWIPEGYYDGWIPYEIWSA